jgi:hypothetical protein
MNGVQVLYSIYFTIALTLLIALIRLLKEDDAKLPYLFNVRVLLYVLILLVGNIATTLMAVKLTEKYLTDQSGPAWFWVSFLGVFGFEAIVKNINITMFKTGVLTINDWIDKAMGSAVESIKQKEVEDKDSEVIVAKPGIDFRYKALCLDLLVDIESSETAKITETQKLKCCVDRLNEISTTINSDGEVLNFKDDSGNFSEIQKGKFRTVFQHKKKNDVFDRKLTYTLLNSFMGAEEESWSLQFETPTKEYTLRLILPADRIMDSFRFYRILHLTHEIDHKSDVEELFQDGRPHLFVAINNLRYKEAFRLSWRWRKRPVKNADGVKQ